MQIPINDSAMKIIINDRFLNRNLDYVQENQVAAYYGAVMEVPADDALEMCKQQMCMILVVDNDKHARE